MASYLEKKAWEIKYAAASPAEKQSMDSFQDFCTQKFGQDTHCDMAKVFAAQKPFVQEKLKQYMREHGDLAEKNIDKAIQRNGGGAEFFKKMTENADSVNLVSVITGERTMGPKTIQSSEVDAAIRASIERAKAPAPTPTPAPAAPAQAPGPAAGGALPVGAQADPPAPPSPVKPAEPAPVAAPPPPEETVDAGNANEEQKGAVLRSYFKMAAENPHMKDNLKRSPGTEKKFFELAAEDPAAAQSVLDDVQNKRGMFSKLVDHKEWEKIAPEFQQMLASGLKEKLGIAAGDPAAADIDGFAKRVAANEDMGRAIFTATTQGQDGKMMKALEDAFHKDKGLFNKANDFIDNHPQQLSMVTEQFLNDPKKAFKTMETIEIGSQIKSAGQSFFNSMGWQGGGRMFGGMMDWMMSSPLGMILLSFIGPLLAKFMGSREEMDETVKAGTEANPASVATNNEAKLIEAITKNGGTVKDQNGRTWTINPPSRDRNPGQDRNEPDPQTVAGPRAVPNPPTVV